MPASFLVFDLHFGIFTLSINLSTLILSETVALWRRYQIYRGKVKRKRRLLYAPREKVFMISSVEFGENFLPADKHASGFAFMMRSLSCNGRRHMKVFLSQMNWKFHFKGLGSIKGQYLCFVLFLLTISFEETLIVVLLSISWKI